jgi:alanine racemase
MTVSSLRTAEKASGLLCGRSLKIHVKLDTGMCRTGFDVSDDSGIADAAGLFMLPGIVPEGVYTHFAVSDIRGDNFTELQFERFIEAVSTIEALSGRYFKIKHCANSAAVINCGCGMSLDMIRPGISLYGSYPGADRGGIDLLPVMTLFSRAAAVFRRKRGETVSYGRTFTLERDSRVAVLPIGYGDGLPRILSGALSVSFGGKSAKQLGRICMDMCMVDITHIPCINEGDVSVIFGDGGISAAGLAGTAKTISYELFCGITARVPRIYI